MHITDILVVLLDYLEVIKSTVLFCAISSVCSCSMVTLPAEGVKSEHQNCSLCSLHLLFSTLKIEPLIFEDAAPSALQKVLFSPVKKN